jgi:hypothetical protein
MEGRREPRKEKMRGVIERGRKDPSAHIDGYISEGSWRSLLSGAKLGARTECSCTCPEGEKRKKEG